MTADHVKLTKLLEDIRACKICKDLPLGPNPILQIDQSAKILIVGQAPGRITHLKNIPFDDPSGTRLRKWMGVTKEMFYNDKMIAILPMGFCYPGTGKSGDLPPRPECAPAWRESVLESLNNVKMTVIIGSYAIKYHVSDGRNISLTQRVSEWKSMFPKQIILPHPSPRNNRWLKQNPWFEKDVLPDFQSEIAKILNPDSLE